MSPRPSPTELTLDSTASDPQQWLAEHGDLLYRFAQLRVQNAHVAEDLVQETLCLAVENYPRFRHESTVRTWLFSILRNEINRFFRNQNKQRTMPAEHNDVTLDQLLHPQIENQEFASAVEREEFWDIIQACFEKLPSHLLETFLYRLANPDEKIDNLCCDLEIKPANFSVRLFRTRLLLRRCLEDQWMN